MDEDFAAELDSHLRRSALQEGQDAGLHAKIIFDLRIGAVFHGAGERGDKAVSDKDPEERTDQGAADQVAKDSRGLGDGAHGVNNAENGGDDPQRGQAVRHRLDGMGGVSAFNNCRFKLLIHQGFDFMRLFGAEGDQAQVVAQERNGMVVFVETRKFFEEVAFVRFFNMPFQRQPAFGTRRLENGEEHAEQFNVLCLAVFIGFINHLDVGEGLLNGVLIIGHQKGHAGGTEDDDELERLPEDVQVPAVERITAEGAKQNP